MASAQTEPSMDEILASIRRIISEEDDAPQEVPVRQKLETLQLGGEQEAKPEEEAEAEKPKPRARAKKAEPAPEPPAPAPEPAEAEAEADTEGEPEAEGGSDHVSEAGAQDARDAQDEATDGLDDFEPLPEEPVAASSTMEPAAEAHDHGEVKDDTFDDEQDAAASEAPQAEASGSPTVQAISDAVRPAATAAVMNGLSVSDQSAGKAANAFGALEENMRLSSGSGRTIEDLIEGMLAPMLSAWLDENLPRIVEDKVEEEVRRISRRR